MEYLVATEPNEVCDTLYKEEEAVQNGVPKVHVKYP